MLIWIRAASVYAGGESEAAQRAVEVLEAVVSRHGYSKEQRPDLK